MLKINKKIGAMFVSIQTLFFNVQNVYATALEDTKAVQGTLALIADIINVLQILIVAGTTGYVLYEFFLMRGADDQDKKPHKKNLKWAVGIGAGSLFIAEVIDVVLAYYQ